MDEVDFDVTPEIDEEIEALVAIYGSECCRVESVANANKWMAKLPQKRVVLVVQPLNTELAAEVAVELWIQFSSKYPREAPLLSCVALRGTTETQALELARLLRAKALSLLGAALCYDVIEEARLLLDTLNTATGASVFDDMQRSNAARAESAALRKRASSHERLRLGRDEDAALLAALAKELQAKEERQKLLKESRKSSHSLLLAQNDHKNTNPPSISFAAVRKADILASGLLSTVYNAVLLNDHPSTISVPLMIHSIPIRNPHYLANPESLRDVLSLVKKQSKLAHPNIQLVFDARIVPINETALSDGSFFEILVEAYGQGMYTMENLLKQAGAISINTAVGYIKKLLKGLVHIHANNAIHKDLKCSNIIFCGTPEQVEVKLSGGEYARKLLDLHQAHPFSLDLRMETVFSDGWNPPESLLKKPVFGRKGDTWCLGRSFCNMIFGEKIFKEYPSAGEFMEENQHLMSRAMSAFLFRIFDDDTVERPSAVDLLKDEFLSDSGLGAPMALEIMQDQKLLGSVPLHPNIPPVPAASAPVMASNHSIFTSGGDHASRYHADFEEVDFLGRGGFGSVVKARNRIDNRFYAVKKIKVDSKKGSGVKLLREVQTLSRLHHQNIVRYYQAWFEDAPDDFNDSESESDEFSSDESSSSGFSDSEHEHHLVKSSSDWHSSHRSSHIVFQVSSKGSDAVPESDFSEDEKSMASSAQPEQGVRILFIQMEFCQNNTLQDIIKNGIEVSEAWRLFRQVLEGLSYLHNVSIIHRDLKPSNLFMDSLGNIKIGDFGLARKGKNPIELMTSSSILGESFASGDGTMTQDIGTPVYVAPELLCRGDSAVKYNSKVDVYSLGIVFFEMLYPFGTGMQRVTTLTDLRKPEIIFPSDFDTKKLENAHLILKSMLTHDPKDRPSCQEQLE
ncbi:hypothetical protein HDU98_002860, partial [Podochytrium sp. JEL0797]